MNLAQKAGALKLLERGQVGGLRCLVDPAGDFGEAGKAVAQKTCERGQRGQKVAAGAAVSGGRAGEDERDVAVDAGCRGLAVWSYALANNHSLTVVAPFGAARVSKRFLAAPNPRLEN